MESVRVGGRVAAREWGGGRGSGDSRERSANTVLVGSRRVLAATTDGVTTHPPRNVRIMIYLDHAASTPCDPDVVEAMLPWFTTSHGNASSPHRRGRAAAHAVRIARTQVADLAGVEPQQVIFVSGATEAINVGLSMAASLRNGEATGIVTAATEHKATLEAAAATADRHGWPVAFAPVDEFGRVAPHDIDDKPAVATFMAVNNETGTCNPWEELASIYRDAGAVTFCDTTQAAGKIPLNLNNTAVDFACVSGHKIGGPQGVGALIVPRLRPDTWRPTQVGGTQERGLRAGTLNVPGIVGLGAAAAASRAMMTIRRDAVVVAADAFEEMFNEISPVRWDDNGAPDVPHITNVWLEGIDNTVLMARCPDVAFATGSACNSDLPDPSHVLRAMGYDEQRARESIRLSFSHTTTVDDARRAASLLAAAATEIVEASR